MQKLIQPPAVKGFKTGASDCIHNKYSFLAYKSLQ